MIMFVNLVLLILLALENHAREIGDLCILPNGENGTCTHFNECAGAAEAVRRRERPEICSFQGIYPIICCESTILNNAAVPVGEKSIKFCNKYHYPAPPPPPPRCFNGICQEVKPVYGGFNSLAAEFPHMAVLGYDKDNSILWGCGGSLISEKFILTAAHCLYSRQFGLVTRVRLGDLNLNITTDDAQPQEFSALKLIKHPEYKPPSKYHDIGLIELDRAVITTIYVQPACLYTYKEICPPMLIATGWGSKYHGGEFTDHLQKVILEEVSNERCRKTYRSNKRKLLNGIVDEWQLCAGADDGDTCLGDSGGPLQVIDRDYIHAHKIIGITSFGKVCSVGKGPGIYTRVSNYIEWIESIVWPN